MQCCGHSPNHYYQMVIDDFPDEVFEIIISFLNLEDRKIASLVNHRWSQFAFSRKALTDVFLDINCARQTAQDYWLSLENSSRNYSSIVLKFSEDEEGYLLKILYKFSDTLYNLSIQQDPDARILRTKISHHYLAQLLNNIRNVRTLEIRTILEIFDFVENEVHLPNLHQLKSICLYTHSLEEEWFDWSVVAPNIESIGVPLEDGQKGFPSIIQYFSKQLINLSIDARYLERDQLSFWQNEFSSLNKFRVLYPINNMSVTNQVNGLIARFPSLTEISLFDKTICFETLQTIADNYNQLKIISLDTNSVPETTFAVLSKLPHLTQLILHKMNVEPAMIILAGSFLSLKQLTFLSLRIDSPEAFFEEIQKKMPKLTILELLDRFRFGINNFNQNGVVSAVCKNLRKLNRLSLVDWAILNTSVFNDLSLLENLTELRLKCIGLNPNCSIAPCSSIKKIIIDVDTFAPPITVPPVGTTLPAEFISKSFPGLMTIEVSKCLVNKTKKAELEISALKESLEKCVLYQKSRLNIGDKDYTSLL